MADFEKEKLAVDGGDDLESLRRSVDTLKEELHKPETADGLKEREKIVGEIEAGIDTAISKREALLHKGEDGAAKESMETGDEGFIGRLKGFFNKRKLKETWKKEGVTGIFGMFFGVFTGKKPKEKEKEAPANDPENTTPTEIVKPEEKPEAKAAEGPQPLEAPAPIELPGEVFAEKPSAVVDFSDGAQAKFQLAGAGHLPITLDEDGFNLGGKPFSVEVKGFEVGLKTLEPLENGAYKLVAGAMGITEEAVFNAKEIQELMEMLERKKDDDEITYVDNVPGQGETTFTFKAA